MKERPIVLGADEVLAVLDGRKTQVLRVVKDQQPDGGRGLIAVRPHNLPDGRWRFVAANTGVGLGDAFRCPYGVPGDRLWVEETWFQGYATVYRANDPDASPSGDPADRWRYPVAMPRWASRIDLEVMGVRVERVQEIRTSDIVAEGCLPDMRYLGSANRYRHAFEALWDSINAKRGFSWESNPWVWIVEFERVRVT